MTAKEFQRLVTRDKSNFLDRFLEILRQLDVLYCMVGGLAVNAYAEPVITLDCDPWSFSRATSHRRDA